MKASGYISHFIIHMLKIINMATVRIVGYVLQVQRRGFHSVG